MPDVIHYVNEIVVPYQPKQVVIYVGDNDLASSDKITADTVVKNFGHLFYMIRRALPKANISFISIKPSPSRRRLTPEIVKANATIKLFLSKQKNTSFIDVYYPMLVNKQPMPNIFLGDSLHMNASGYAIWKKAIQPHLLR